MEIKKNNSIFRLTMYSLMTLTFMSLVLFFPGIKVHADSSTYELYVNGVQVTDDNKNNVLGDSNATVKFDSGSKTLILNNANITQGVDQDFLSVEDNEMITMSVGIASGLSSLTIEGNAIISIPSNGTVADTIGIGMLGIGDLIINGTGAGINSIGTVYGIARAGEGELRLKGKITAEGTGSLSGGIYADNNIVIENGTITAKGKYHGISNYHEKNNVPRTITILGGNVKAIGTGSNYGSYGIDSYDSVFIKGGTIYAEGMQTSGIRTRNNAVIEENITKVAAKTTNGEADIIIVGNPDENYLQLANNLIITTPENGYIYENIFIKDAQGNFAKNIVIEPKSSGNPDDSGNSGESNPSGDTDPNSSSNDNIPRSISLNTESIILRKGKTSNKVKVTLKNDSIKEVVSDNPGIAKVSFNSNILKIKAVKVGKTVIRFTSEHGNTCILNVSVQNRKVKTKKLKVSNTSVTLEKKEELQKL